MLSLDKAQEILRAAGFQIEGQPKRYSNYGWTIKLANGCAVIIYDKGSFQIVGGAREQVEKAVKANLMAYDEFNTKVFVVYGHDRNARDQLELLLRKLELIPLFLDDLPSGGKTIIEKLEKYIPQANFGVVLLTPDDIGCKRTAPQKARPRARQNVILELGMLYMKLSRGRVALIVKKSDDEIELPSDLEGIMRLNYMDSVQEVEGDLVRELKDKGYHLNHQT